MKVRNHTHYRTDDLRRILNRVASDELEVDKRKRVRVDVRYARTRGTCSGYAYIGGSVCTVRINKHEPNPAAFAKVAAHEYAHLRGMSHQTMPTRYKWASPTWKDRYEWANALGIRVKTAKPKATVDEKRAAKLAHAEKMHRRALTRLKRATSLEQKWRKTIRRLQRVIASPLKLAAEGPK